MSRPQYKLEVGFTSTPDEPIASTVWTDITAWLVVGGSNAVKIMRGRTDEQGDVQPSEMSFTLDNRDGRFTAERAASPYYPNVRIGKRVRLALVLAGTTFYRFTGDVNEWPTEWQGGAALTSQIRVTATDRLKKMGSLAEFGPLLNEMLNYNDPVGMWPLKEPKTATSAADASGRDEAPLLPRQIGTGGSVNFGSELSSATFFDDGITVGFNPASAGNGKFLQAYLRKPFTGVATGATVVGQAQESPLGVLPTGPLIAATASNGSWLAVTKVASGNVTASYYDKPSDTRYDVVSGIGFNNQASTQYAAVLDFASPGVGRLSFHASSSSTYYGTPITFPLTTVPVWTNVSVGGRAKELFRGNIAHVALFAKPLTIPNLRSLYFAAYYGYNDYFTQNAWRRMDYLCTLVGLAPVSWYNGGYPYAPQQLAGQQIEGAPPDAMRLLESTEGAGGMFYLKGDGGAHFMLRGARYNQAVNFTIPASRIDPDSFAFRGDDYGLVNDVTVSRPGGGFSARMVNTASVGEYGRRKASEEAVPEQDDGLRALGAWRANSWGVQRNRATGVKVSLLNDPAQHAAALGLRPGERIQITTLPGQAPTATVDLIAEGWTEIIGENEWSMDFNTSPADLYAVWEIGTLGSIGTTLRIPL